MDTMLLLVSIVAFAALVLGWMILPDAPKAESAVSTSTRVAEAA